MKTHPFNTIAILLATTLATTSLNAAKLEEITTHVIPQENITSLDVRNVNGSITCVAWDKAEIELTCIKKAKAATEEDAQKLLDSVRVDISQGDDKISIRTVYPDHKKFAFWDWFKRNHHSASVDYEIRVPKDLNLQTNSVNGSTKVEGISGSLHSNSVNGQLTAKNISAPASMNTVNGSVHCTFADDLKVEEMEFGSVNGGINIYLPETIQCSISVSTVNGSINTDLSISELETKKRRSLKCEINGGGPLLRFHTVNGSVSIMKSS